MSHVEKVKNYSKRFPPGHWTFLGPGSEKKWNGNSYDGHWERTVNRIVQQFRETSHSIFTVTSVVSRGMLKQRIGKSTIHFNGYFMNTELLFQTVNSVNQVSIYAAVTNWCYKFALKKKEKEHIPTSVDHRMLTIVEPEEVKMLTSSPNLAQETSWWRVRQYSEYWKRRFTWPIMWKSFILSQPEVDTKFNQMEKTDGDKSPFMQRICLFSSRPTSPTVGSYPSGRPISEVHIVNILDEYGLEVPNPSICKLET